MARLCNASLVCRKASKGKLYRDIVLALLLLLVLLSNTLKRNYVTILGDGLSATPWQRWHRWPRHVALRRAAEILWCDHVRCADPVVVDPTNGQRKQQQQKEQECPRYFEWIHKDLSPWEIGGGISQWDVHSAQRDAAFRVLIVDGKLYVDPYYSCHFGRAELNVWGLLMLLERFPGQVNDVDLMFNCADRPRVWKKQWWRRARPLFGYSTRKDGSSLDIPFPDWSFWAWPEKGISHWEEELGNILKESGLRRWSDKEPYAYWKGALSSSRTRKNLAKCNVSSSGHIRLYHQNWETETVNGFNNSSLSKQCNHKYKIYAEGYGWSASYKYTLACGSTVLAIDHEYDDFFSRALTSFVHYMPVTRRRETMCEALRSTVTWLNANPVPAERIGRRGQEFASNELSMDRIYDYMFHLLNKYSKLQKFKPKVPPSAKRVCPERIRCLADPTLRNILDGLPRPTPSRPCSIRA